MKRLVILALVALGGVAQAQPTPIYWRPPSGCSASQAIVWSGSAWTCGTVSTFTTNNTIPKGNGTGLTASSWTDDGATSTTTGKVVITAPNGGNAIALNIIDSATGQTDNSHNINTHITGSYDTTAGNLFVTPLESIISATESGGGNTLTNIAAYLSATGGDVNYGLWVDDGTSRMDGDATVAGSLTSGDGTGDVFDHNGTLAKFGNASDGATYIYDDIIAGGYNTNAAADLAFNFYGYLASTTQFRNTKVYDGKSALVATFTGSDKSLAVVGNLSTDASLGVGITPLTRAHIRGTGGASGITPTAGTVLTVDNASADSYISITNATNTMGLVFGNASSAADGYLVYNTSRGMEFATAGTVWTSINSSGLLKHDGNTQLGDNADEHYANNTLNFDNYTNGAATGNINLHGYAGGSSQWRNLTIWDGAAGEVATFTGSTHSLNVVGDLSTDSDLIVDLTSTLTGATTAHAFLAKGDNTNSVTALAGVEFATGRDSSGNLHSNQTSGDIAIAAGTGGFRHWIASRNSSTTTSAGNNILIYINDSATSGGSSGPGTGNNLIMTLDETWVTTEVGVNVSNNQDLFVSGDTDLGESVNDTITFTGKVDSHIVTASAPPAASSCGGSPAVVGSDTFFRVTTGSAATGCVLTFASAFSTNAPVCAVTPADNTDVFTVSISTTALTLGSTPAGAVYYVVCGGYL